MGDDYIWTKNKGSWVRVKSNVNGGVIQVYFIIYIRITLNSRFKVVLLLRNNYGLKYNQRKDVFRGKWVLTNQLSI